MKNGEKKASNIKALSNDTFALFFLRLVKKIKKIIVYNNKKYFK